MGTSLVPRLEFSRTPELHMCGNALRAARKRLLSLLGVLEKEEGRRKKEEEVDHGRHGKSLGGLGKGRRKKEEL